MTKEQLFKAKKLAGTRVCVSFVRGSHYRPIQIWGSLEVISEEPFHAILHSDFERHYDLREDTELEFITSCIATKDETDYSARNKFLAR